MTTGSFMQRGPKLPWAFDLAKEMGVQPIPGSPQMASIEKIQKRQQMGGQGYATGTQLPGMPPSMMQPTMQGMTPPMAGFVKNAMQKPGGAPSAFKPPGQQFGQQQYGHPFWWMKYMQPGGNPFMPRQAGSANPFMPGGMG
jgi:hypothetical protein